MVKTVFLDLDDTILDFHQAEVSALRRTLQEAGVDSSDAVLGRYHVINKQHREMLEEGTITRAPPLEARYRSYRGEMIFSNSSAPGTKKAPCERFAS